MMGKRDIPLNSGDEHDVFSRWRHVMCRTQRPGVCKQIKRGFTRRVRRFASKLVHNVLLGLPEEL